MFHYTMIFANSFSTLGEKKNIVKVLINHPVITNLTLSRKECLYSLAKTIKKKQKNLNIFMMIYMEVGFCQLMLVPVPQSVHTCFITSTVLILLQIEVGSGGAV